MSRGTNGSRASRPTRRRFLKSAALATGAAVAVGTGCATRRRPNLLVVIVDEHAAEVAGCYGDRLAQTPHLDAFAAQGVLFEHCYTPSPVCGPARETFLAGQRVSQTGVWGNSCWLPSPDTPTWTGALRAAGYDVVLSGKMHLDRSRRHGMRELWPSHANQFHKTGRGVRRDRSALRAPSTLWAKRAAAFRADEESVVLRHDRTAVDAAAGFLTARRSAEGPFCLVVGLIAPHFPLAVPQRWLSRFRDRVPAPNVPSGYVETLPLNYRLYRAALGPTDDAGEATRIGRACYWALVGWMDEQFGQLLAALERSAVAEETVVVFTSDHGENKGDHGMWWKGAMFDSAARVPLVIRWPERWPGGARRSGALTLLDLACTLGDLGAVEASAPEWSGRSLLPWLDDAAHPWPGHAVSEYYGHYVASGFTMLREGPWKYVYHARPAPDEPPERELYRLDRDPGELDNRVADPELASELQRLHRRLEAEVGGDLETIEARCRREIARGYGREPDPRDRAEDLPDREEGLDD